MFAAEIPEHREQCSGISNFLVRIRVIGTLFNKDFGVGLLEILIEKSDVAHDPQTVG